MLTGTNPDVLSVDLRQMKEVLGFSNHQSCIKEAALLDFYVCGFWWAKEANFTAAQTSFTMAVLNMLLDNIKGGKGTVGIWKFSCIHILYIIIHHFVSLCCY